MITTQRLRELLEYRDGKLFWKICRKGRSAGSEVGSLTHHGYLRAVVDGERHMVHRIVWALHHGKWPEGIVDHIDGVRLNNRIENLRSVDHQQNMRNQKLPATNTSGFIGVFWNCRRNRWVAQIKVDGKYKHVGYFDTAQAADTARKAAAGAFGYHENHGRSV
ncbi:AP2 domain protein [compost metagenome]